MTGRAASLTARGRLMLAAAAVLLLAGWLFGIEELYSVALAAAVLAFGARLWVDLRAWDLRVSRLVHPARVAAGQEARVELAVRNTTTRPSPPVEGRDPFDGGKRWARFSIAPLHPGEVRTSSYRLPSTRRGVYRLGPLELRLTDPLGLASCSRTTAVETTLTVHPRYDLVPVLGVSSHRDEDRRLPQPKLGKGGNEFYTLRQYVAGDDLRHVHWPTTARLDDLVIRQPENLRRGRMTVVADIRSTVHDDETLESVLSAAASLAMSGLRSALEVRVVTTAGWDSGHGPAKGHGPALLDGLAAAVAHRPQPGVTPFRLAGHLEPVVVVTTDRCPDADLESAFGMGGPTGTTLVVFESGVFETGVFETGVFETGAGVGGVGGHGRRSGRRTLRVGRDESFASAWATYTRAVVTA